MSKEIDVTGIRKSLNWTRARLAKEAGVNVSTVCRWENGGVPERGTARSFLDRLSRRAALRSRAEEEGAPA